MIRRLFTLAAVTAAVAASACAPTSLFEWGNYEPALYAYSQNPENRGVYKDALEKAIEKGRARDAVAPGLLAELGYLHLEDGNTTEALRYFQEERARFPESAGLMDRVIARLNGGAAVSGGN
ncbi:DUF4810 domain-containing protein [uncultured Brevundimonas sp.]|mgnify:CR=1 FL=1|jgi:hypothetical protein|uniref:DUF4810 domain-containing protein n=1 Tax=uncultured Brevundimonas sp. TaxID=213418 RepID=UPI0030ECE171|tara:strand:- start:4959 stop:5324 length:366 start_codon:yes stop_codon:yes gene_type:complete